ncbi:MULTISPECIES: DUF202 domain-containing protein [unclassified Aeromicrobium]|uniref:DUF202 domain-containing protein n=1 Tax=unclassified Aeromicrobium TaxID=2633570 RepID=UPI00396B0CF3
MTEHREPTERTVLAWQRTLLSLVVMLVVTARIALEGARAWTFVLASVAAVLMLVLFVPLHLRSRRIASGRQPAPALVLRDGRAPLLLAASLALPAAALLLQVAVRR